MDVVRYLTDETPTALPQWREAERVLHAQHRHPQPVWKLLGAGAVGSQALVGIPVVAALRDDPELAAVSRVWPFEGWTSSGRSGAPAIVHAEIWPSIVDISTAIADPVHAGKVRDQVQVEQLAAKFCEDDLDGRLGSLLASVPSGALTEEGWVLGI